MASKKGSPGGGGGEMGEGKRPRLRTSHGKAGGPRKAPPPPRAKARPAPRPTPRDTAPASRGAAERRTPRSLLVQSGPSQASESGRELATQIAIAALEKKAVALEILDVAGKVDYADFLVLMTGRSDRQVAALAQGIEEALAKRGKRVLSIEGMPQASWVLMDFGDVVVHVLQEEARQSYDLDGLWVDARRVAVPPAPEGR